MIWWHGGGGGSRNMTWWQGGGGGLATPRKWWRHLWTAPKNDAKTAITGPAEILMALAERLPTSATLPLMKAKFVNKVYVSGFWLTYTLNNFYWSRKCRIPPSNFIQVQVLSMSRIPHWFISLKERTTVRTKQFLCTFKNEHCCLNCQINELFQCNKNDPK